MQIANLIILLPALAAAFPFPISPVFPAIRSVEARAENVVDADASISVYAPPLKADADASIRAYKTKTRAEADADVSIKVYKPREELDSDASIFY